MDKFACAAIAALERSVSHCLFVVEAESPTDARDKASALALRAFPEDEGYRLHKVTVMDVRQDPIEPTDPRLVLAWPGGEER